MKYMLLSIFAAATLMAADATGNWTGTLIAPTPDGGERQGSAYLVLKQEGATVTGTAGPNATDQQTIQNGKAENGNVTFQVSRNDWTMKFVLRQEGDEIKGEVTRERDGQTEKAKLSVRRDK